MNKPFNRRRYIVEMKRRNSAKFGIPKKDELSDGALSCELLRHAGKKDGFTKNRMRNPEIRKSGGK